MITSSSTYLRRFGIPKADSHHHGTTCSDHSEERTERMPCWDSHGLWTKQPTCNPCLCMCALLMCIDISVYIYITWMFVFECLIFFCLIWRVVFLLSLYRERSFLFRPAVRSMTVGELGVGHSQGGQLNSENRALFIGHLRSFFLYFSEGYTVLLFFSYLWL